MLALQTVAARRAATEAGSAGIARGTAVIGVGAALVFVALSPALAAFLHLRDIQGILLVAASVPASAVIGAAMGLAQGRRQFGRLAMLIAVGTGGRSAAGLVGLALGRTPRWTVAAIAIGLTVTAVLVVGRGPALATRRMVLLDRARSGVLVETLNAGHAHGVFLLLTSLDVLLARHVLSSDAAGVYAVGSVLTRITVWLPQAVIALLFASLAEPARHRRTARQATLVVVGIGLVGVAATALAGRLAVTVIGGAKYHQLDSAMWLFALLGALLAMLQLSMLAGLAQRTARRAALLWATVVADVGVVLVTADSATPTRLVTTLVAVAAAAAAVALWVTLRGPAVGTLLRRPAMGGLGW
jgi:O-antigen/teichoic acid export membrane protein